MTVTLFDPSPESSTDTDVLAAGSLDSDARLLDVFQRVRRRFRGAIVGMTARTTITNASAAELLGSSDHHALRTWLQTADDVPEAGEVVFHLASGLTATARVYHILMQGLRVGVVLHLSVSTRAHLRLAGTDGEAGTPDRGPAGASGPISAALDPALLSGWAELTDSERAVAELVGRGLSNKEAGRKLFVSRHTVDHHLRGVFKKLGITSRVELARLLGEHYESLASGAPSDAVA